MRHERDYSISLQSCFHTVRLSTARRTISEERPFTVPCRRASSKWSATSSLKGQTSTPLPIFGRMSSPLESLKTLASHPYIWLQGKVCSKSLRPYSMQEQVCGLVGFLTGRHPLILL